MYLIDRLILMHHPNDLIHRLLPQVISPPSRSAEQEQSLDVRDAEDVVGFALFVGGEELEGVGELFLFL